MCRTVSGREAFEKIQQGFAAELALFPLLIIRNLLNEGCFCVKSKANSYLTGIPEKRKPKTLRCDPEPRILGWDPKVGP